MATGAATIAPVWAAQDFWTLAGAVGQWLCKTAAGRSVADGRAVRATDSRPFGAMRKITR